MIIPNISISKTFKHNAILHKNALYIAIIGTVAGSAASLLYMLFPNIPQPMFFILAAVLFAYLAQGTNIAEKALWIIIVGVFTTVLVFIFSIISHIIYLVIPALAAVIFVTYFLAGKYVNWMFICKFGFTMLALCLYPGGNWYLGLQRGIAVLLATAVTLVSMIIVTWPESNKWYKASFLQWRDMLTNALMAKAKSEQLANNLELYTRDYSALLQQKHQDSALTIEILTSTSTKLAAFTLDTTASLPEQIKTNVVKLVKDCNDCIYSHNSNAYIATHSALQQQRKELSDQRYFRKFPTQQRAEISRMYYIADKLRDALENFCNYFPKGLK